MHGDLNPLERQEPMNNPYSDYISNMEFSSNVKDTVKVYDANIYATQMEEDLSALEYILCNIYSGKDFLKKRGIDISGRLNDLRSKIIRVDRMNKVEFFEVLCAALREIEDNHLVFTLPYFEKTHRFCIHHTVYFADFVLQKREDEYIVSASDDPSIKCGDVITAEEAHLYPTADGQLLYGVFSKQRIQTVACVCNGREVRINVSPVPTKKSDAKIWSYEKYQNIDLVTIHRFAAFNEAEKQDMNELLSLGSKLKKSKQIIIDLRGNYGGDSEYVRQFVENLNGRAVFNLGYAQLNTQGSRLAEISLYTPNLHDYEKTKKEILADPAAQWQCTAEQPIYAGQYQNDLLLLTDRETASSAEIMVKCVKDNIPQCVVIGENTSGTLSTGDIRYFYLPNSLIFLNIPTAIFAGVFEEGTGFLPDFWSKDAMQCAINVCLTKNLN